MMLAINQSPHTLGFCSQVCTVERHMKLVTKDNYQLKTYYKQRYGSTIEHCAYYCLKEEGSNCMAYEYDEAAKICRLSTFVESVTNYKSTSAVVYSGTSVCFPTLLSFNLGHCSISTPMFTRAYLHFFP